MIMRPLKPTVPLAPRQVPPHVPRDPAVAELLIIGVNDPKLEPLPHELARVDTRVQKGLGVLPVHVLPGRRLRPSGEVQSHLPGIGVIGLDRTKSHPHVGLGGNGCEQIGDALWLIRWTQDWALPRSVRVTLLSLPTISDRSPLNAQAIALSRTDSNSVWARCGHEISAPKAAISRSGPRMGVSSGRDRRRSGDLTLFRESSGSHQPSGSRSIPTHGASWGKASRVGTEMPLPPAKGSAGLGPESPLGRRRRHHPGVIDRQAERHPSRAPKPGQTRLAGGRRGRRGPL